MANETVSGNPVPAGSGLWRRRLWLAAALVLLLAALLLRMPSRAELQDWITDPGGALKDASQEIINPSPEPALRELVAQGALQPARQNEIDTWKRRAGISEEGVLYTADTFVVRRAVTLPPNMYGAHSRAFLIPPGVALPKDDPGGSHNSFHLADGTCLGSGPHCTR